MLVLSRAVGESIIINGYIKVTVLRNERGETSIGVDAPKYVAVDREEIHDKKMLAKKKGVA